MKTLTTILLIIFLVNSAFASLDLEEKMTIAKAKETLTRMFGLNTDEITDSSSCEQIDAFLKKNDIRMSGINEQIITAKQGILCESEKPATSN